MPEPTRYEDRLEFCASIVSDRNKGAGFSAHEVATEMENRGWLGMQTVIDVADYFIARYGRPTGKVD